MYKLAIIIILSIAIAYFLFRNNSINEGMNGNQGVSSNEAIQNLASLYNEDKMKVSNLDVTDTTKTNTLQLGDKWKVTAGKDAWGYDDDWIRFYKADGSAAYFGGIATGRLFDASSGGQISTLLGQMRDRTEAVNTGIQNRINNFEVARSGRYCHHHYHVKDGSNITDCYNICKAKGELCADVEHGHRCHCGEWHGLGKSGNWTSRLIF
ncbi:MAG: hypothetical protein ACFFKA_06680 [Candidatus Thorarchaeota archaeon]